MALSRPEIEKIRHQQILVDDLSDRALAEFCEYANEKYRSGAPIISDRDYDFLYLPALKKRLPDHPLICDIEPEGAGFSDEKFTLPEAMLSTDKAYSFAEILKWFERLEKSAAEIDIDPQKTKIKATPKLDGFAGFDDGVRLYTRGDGRKGSDISRVFERGLKIFNDAKRGLGAGEIVVKKSYFQKYLAAGFEHPRNFQASLIKEKSLEDAARRAIEKKAALFVPFSELPNWQGTMNEIHRERDFHTIVERMKKSVDFDVDGVIFEATDAALKTHIGANRKFHRWQIAYKENLDKAQVKVLRVIPQVGRSGKITPVAELEPTALSGATIHRASAHHFGFVRAKNLGAGSVVELVRSGAVIPKINQVLKPGQGEIPKFCPSCETKLIWDADFLICPNHQNCRGQIIGRIRYFFHTLANNDGFGRSTVETMVENGVRRLSDVYDLSAEDLREMGFGDKTSANLRTELLRSRTEIVEDWRFLAAFGVVRLGLANAENLLTHYPLAEIFNLSAEAIEAIDGFGDLSAGEMVAGLKQIHDEFLRLSNLGFQLEITKKIEASEHPLFAKNVVFSGTMTMPRAVMKKRAKALGMRVSSSVSGKTDYLVVGEKVGAVKIQKAEALGVEIIDEAAYRSLLEN